MGHDAERGREAYIRNIVYSKVSNFELSVWRSLLFSAKTLPVRIKRQLPWIVIPPTFFYLLADWADNYNYHLHRKNPADYANDE